MVVYSRWCGELISDIQHCGAKRGLSPLARGTHERGTPGRLIVRFIPAGAGNSPCAWWTTTRMAVYPRWRGELAVPLHQRVQNPGLSPLARGTHILIGIHELRPRFIPAGAGNSATRWQSSYPTTVYPRWRGELTKHNLLLIIDFLSQSQSTNLTETHKQHIHYVKEHLIHWLKSQIFKVILYRLKSTKLRRNNFHSNEKLTPQNL